MNQRRPFDMEDDPIEHDKSYGLPFGFNELRPMRELSDDDDHRQNQALERLLMKQAMKKKKKRRAVAIK